MDVDEARPAGWRQILNPRRFFRAQGDANVVRIRRRRALISALNRRLPILRLALFAAGYIWMLLIPFPDLGRGTYIDENALQPGQVHTHWNWGEVHDADRYLEHIESLRNSNSSSEHRAQYFVDEFGKLGLFASQQSYQFTSSSGDATGINAYAILSSPRASGTEAMLVSASWISRIDEGADSVNVRGIATVLSLAKFLKQYSLWAKDIIFVISDGYLDGMQAWLNGYHGVTQSNLQAERVELGTGIIWTALNIDYPGHSFSHLGIFHEGLNGRLPNQDLINSFQRISKYTGGVPLTLYDHIDPREFPAERTKFSEYSTWLPTVVRDNANLQAYWYQARNFVRGVQYQARGRGSGVHALFHKFRIDAFTMFGIPATGPHGFHAIGRIIESTLRTTNNLLERLHASFFFYILTAPDRFVKIGNYLPSVIIISTAMMFGGLKAWTDAAWVVDEDQEKSSPKWLKRRRPILRSLGVILLTHILGVVTFLILSTRSAQQHLVAYSLVLLMAIGSLSCACLHYSRGSNQNYASDSDILKAMNLCLASTVISIITVLNFSLALCLTVLLGVPLSLSGSHANVAVRVLSYIGFLLLGFGWLLAGKQIGSAVWDWQVLGVWFAPFVCAVYAPLTLQAGVACLLPP